MKNMGKRQFITKQLIDFHGYRTTSTARHNHTHVLRSKRALVSMAHTVDRVNAACIALRKLRATGCHRYVLFFSSCY